MRVEALLSFGFRLGRSLTCLAELALVVGCDLIWKCSLDLGEHLFDAIKHVWMSILCHEIDETILRDIAKLTGGRYFRATNGEKLASIYTEIDELEKTKRGPYAGIVGYLDFNGNLDNAIAIRTMVITPRGASVQAGAGIVVDSDPVAEYNECWAKAKALIAAVKPAEQMTRVRRNAKG